MMNKMITQMGGYKKIRCEKNWKITTYHLFHNIRTTEKNNLLNMLGVKRMHETYHALQITPLVQK